jgi:hypothetical protein
MSELSDHIRRENERLSRISIERLEEANARFEIDVDAILRSRNGKRERVWPLWAKVTWFLFCAMVLYAYVWGVLAL